MPTLSLKLGNNDSDQADEEGASKRRRIQSRDNDDSTKDGLSLATTDGTDESIPPRYQERYQRFISCMDEIILHLSEQEGCIRINGTKEVGITDRPGIHGILPHNDILCSHWERLAKALLSNKEAVDALFVCNVQLSKAVLDTLLPALKGANVSCLVFNNNEFGAEGIQFIAEILAHNDCVTKINLEANVFDDTAAAARLSEAINGNPSMYSVQLEDCGFGENLDAFSSLLSALGDKRLDFGFSSNRLGALGAAILAKFLVADPKVDELWVTNNGFDDADAVLVATAVKRNTHLKRLTLFRNAFDSGAQAAFSRMIYDDSSEVAVLNSNHTLRHLSLIRSDSLYGNQPTVPANETDDPEENKRIKLQKFRKSTFATFKQRLESVAVANGAKNAMFVREIPGPGGVYGSQPLATAFSLAPVPEDSPNILSQAEELNYLDQERLNAIRCIIWTPRRGETYHEMRMLFRGEKAGCTFTSSSFSDRIQKSFSHLKSFELEADSWPVTFDNLLTFSIILFHQDVEPWNAVNFNGEDLTKVINQLGKMWKKYLRLSSGELDIDDEFTRPAVEIFLQKLKIKLEGVENVNVEFTYQ